MNGSDYGFTVQPRHALLTRLGEDLRGRLSTVQSEAVTGRFADPEAALGGRVREAWEITLGLDDLARQRESIALAETRFGAMQSVLGRLRGLTDETSATAETALASALPNGRTAVAAAAAGALSDAISALNSSAAGRHVFAGNAGEAQPLAPAQDLIAAVRGHLEGAAGAAAGYSAASADFAAPGGVFEGTLYQGGTGAAPGSEVSRGETVGTDLRADDPVLRDALMNLAVLHVAMDESSALAAEDREELARRATAGLRDASGGLATLSGELGTIEERIARRGASLAAEETALTLALNGQTGRDQFEAASEFGAIEAQLEALFLTTARLSNLTLTNYLR